MYITLIPSGIPTERYAQISKMQNAGRDAKYFVEGIKCDLLIRFGEVHDQLLEEHFNQNASTRTDGVHIKR